MQGAARGARAALAGAQADATVDAALAATLDTWPARWSAALAPGAQEARAVTTIAGAAVVHVTRLDATRYQLDASATAPAGAPGQHAARRRALTVRLRHLAVEPPAALTAGAPVRLLSGAVVAGAQSLPNGWPACPDITADAPAVAVGESGDLRADDADAVLGAVDVTARAREADTYDAFGDERWATLVARADVVVPAGAVVTPAPVAAAGACVTGGASWGEPRRGAGAVAECADAFPVVHVRGVGTTTLRGPARLQGMLLVDGDLAVDGPVDVAGVVVVRGAVRAPAGALAMSGALLVRGDGGESTLGAGSAVRASRCAVDRATASAARPIALRRRAWAEVTR